jgi:Uncharacterized protein conserved in bacteria (DUF2059)
MKNTLICNRLPRTRRPLAVQFPFLTAFMAPLLALLLAVLPVAAPLHAAERTKVEAFLLVTGFDVALDSISQSAANAPAMLGLKDEEFSNEWNLLAARVFNQKVMRKLAIDILEVTLSDEALTHAAGFYASDLGQRLVAVENASQLMQDDEAKRAEGQRIVADLVAAGAPRLELIKRMNRAVGGADFSVQALQEIQVRFLLAASAAGVIALRVDAEELRAMMQEQSGGLRLSLQKSALVGAAYTYRDMSDADIEAYSEALEQPLMQEVYELLNAVQYEIMANRFEVLATKMAELNPSQDL